MIKDGLYFYKHFSVYS